MICLYAETNLSNLTMLLYTCVCTSFVYMMNAASRMLVFLTDPHHQPNIGVSEDWELDLCVVRFEDLKSSCENEEVCAICLMEFEREDLVNELGRCGHVFHVECLEKWFDKCQFNCPLCRSSVLCVRNSPHAGGVIGVPPAVCINLTHAND